MKTSDLTGDALNAVIKRIVLQDGLYTQDREIYTLPYIDPEGWVHPPNTAVHVHAVPPKFARPPTTGKFDPASNERHGMHIIKRYDVKLKYVDFMPAHLAVSSDGRIEQFGSTPQEALLRAVVALRLGDEVEL